MTSKTSDDMTTYTFDTLTYVKELVAAGMSLKPRLFR